MKMKTKKRLEKIYEENCTSETKEIEKEMENDTNK